MSSWLVPEYANFTIIMTHHQPSACRHKNRDRPKELAHTDVPQVVTMRCKH